jgi:hypothetical protein
MKLPLKLDSITPVNDAVAGGSKDWSRMRAAPAGLEAESSRTDASSSFLYLAVMTASPLTMVETRRHFGRTYTQPGSASGALDGLNRDPDMEVHLFPRGGKQKEVPKATTIESVEDDDIQAYERSAYIYGNSEIHRNIRRL